MRVLLDECLPARLRHEIPGQDATTVKQAGWLGIKKWQVAQINCGFAAILGLCDDG